MGAAASGEGGVGNRLAFHLFRGGALGYDGGATRASEDIL
jgi:hypothetical protein